MWMRHSQKKASKKMLGASAVVAQMLIQRGKDKCRLVEAPMEASKVCSTRCNDV